MIQITAFEQLKNILLENDGILDCFILLMLGLRSYKTIEYEYGAWSIYNDIDGSIDDFVSDEIFLEESSIYRAMKNGTLYYEDE